MRELRDDAVPPPERVLAEARRKLADRGEVEHDHSSPTTPCPVCGGHRPDDSNEESE